jgi:hypothetical protein
MEIEMLGVQEAEQQEPALFAAPVAEPRRPDLNLEEDRHSQGVKGLLPLLQTIEILSKNEQTIFFQGFRTFFQLTTIFTSFNSIFQNY